VKYYTGIGARGTPEDIGKIMTAFARQQSDSHTLRSGAADGADTFFEKGASVGDIFLPWPKFNGRTQANVGGLFYHKKYDKEIEKQAEEIASTVHPNWAACNGTVRKFHQRNVYQVLGTKLDSPSDFVVFWAVPEGDQVKGGTNTAVQLAKTRGIPTYNLYEPEVRERIERYLK
tara:strand:+ start:638 stop:1159 length:522 start_codon:yes stop_codon:yes gene_type:complete